MGRCGGKFGWLLALVVSASVGVAAATWACVPMATVQAAPGQVQAGQEVMVSGIRFVGFGPVEIRLHAVDGPVLGTATVTQSSNTIFKTSVTIPPDTPPGPVVLVATQAQLEGGPVPWGVPARTLVTVVGADGNTPPPTPPEVLDRPSTLSRASVSAGALLLVALGVAAVALLVSGALALVASRKGGAVVVPEEAR